MTPSSAQRIPEIPTPAGALAGRRALVTGGAGGLGSGIGKAVAAAGGHVVLADVDEAGLERVVGEITEAGGSAEAWPVDLSDTAALADLRLEVDILVNNAGIQHVQPLHEFDVAKWQLIQQLMLTAPFLLTRAALPHMYASGWGRIINISSAHGLRASEYKSAYVSAKHGLEGLSKVTALEGAPHGVTSNCINPGYVWTPLVEQQLKDQAATHGMSEEEVAEQVMLKKQALKQFASVEAIAQAVLFCCGPHSSSMTGANLVIDGGWSAQ
ncbi:3-hydroxybutyrate dehydrogenase [Kytococcus aerolatus]|uniref:3-hydroxybutyrate dehydrogenase n=1 Tax=Kytococcus aerolatus TaxID=592308 RepID=A0A212U1I1_9MICO|nr:3-hydroxybutyrate dehydrogenase [Kytococcus aerolatus]SNC72010.1 3-hydroxybutyrate dehydrogenase [Kytococcus aerolatus]